LEKLFKLASNQQNKLRQPDFKLYIYRISCIDHFLVYYYYKPIWIVSCWSAKQRRQEKYNLKHLG